MIEVLKQALEALETEVSIDWTNNDEFNASAEKMHDAITSLRPAIAEAEKQEQPLPPVEIGVDVTADGASVVAFSATSLAYSINCLPVYKSSPS